MKKSNKKITIYTDGGSLGNPGPGGYGAVLRYGDKKKEVSGGYRLTTNNRMELLAVISGLEALNQNFSYDVDIYSDSRYIVDAINKGWLRKWKFNSWSRGKQGKVVNPDLWKRLDGLMQKHDVKFHWVKAHAGIPDNERCDQLSKQNAAKPNLPTDLEYEREINKCKEEISFE
jgi:ribonuclease HI